MKVLVDDGDAILDVCERVLRGDGHDVVDRAPPDDERQTTDEDT